MIDEARESPSLDEDSSASFGGPGVAPPAGTTRPLVPWLLSGLLAVATGVALWLALSAPAVRDSPEHLAIPLPADISVFNVGRGSSVAVAPDGRRIIYAGIRDGRRQLYVRALGESATTPIAGTENATSPFFSADGRWIGFTDGAPGGSLKKVPVEGGAPFTIVDSMGDGLNGFAVQGSTWAADNTIVFSAINARSRGLWRVPAAGGVPARLTTPRDGELHHAWPQVLSNGEAVLYTVWNNTGFDGARIVVEALANGERTVLIERAGYGRVVSAGPRQAWLVYARPEALHAAPFDLEHLRVTGPAMPILEGVAVNMSGGAHFSVSDEGLLAYMPSTIDERIKTALWVTRDGIPSEIGVVPGLGFVYRLSPDGQRIARPQDTGPTRDLWVDDLERGGTPTRLTVGLMIHDPTWTPDGRWVIYASAGNLFRKAADGTGAEERLPANGSVQAVGSVSPDGKTLAYSAAMTESSQPDLWLMPLDPPGQPRPLLPTPFTEIKPVISPDGRWIAYQSNMSGAFEIYVAALAGGGRQFPVSRGGGWHPLWEPNGRELYYRDVEPPRGGNMMVASIDTRGAEPAIGTPRVLFPSPYQGDGDIAPDGRFLLLKRTPHEMPSRVIPLITNWFEELRAKVPQ